MIDNGGKVVSELTTDKNGIAISNPLLVGKYTLKSTSTSRIYAFERAN